MLLFATVLTFTACSDDDEPDIELTKSIVVGTWDINSATADGETVTIPQGYAYITLKSDYSYKVVLFGDYYIGTYKIEGNTVVGTTIDPITEYFKFESLDGNDAVINYSNSTGDKYKFVVQKRS